MIYIIRFGVRLPVFRKAFFKQHFKAFMRGGNVQDGFIFQTAPGTPKYIHFYRRRYP